MTFYRPAWAEIDLTKFTSNIHNLQALIGEKKKILAVVKSNAYGHGAVAMAEAAVQAGVVSVGVSCIDEAIELREAGISVPILIMGASLPSFAPEIVEYQLTQNIFTYEMLQALSMEAVKSGRTVKVHVEIDTGMGRFGFFNYDAALDFLGKAAAAPGIEVEGIFTHLSTAEHINIDFAVTQYQKWVEFCSQIKKMGLEIPCVHIANSAAVLQHPYMKSSIVRLGLSMYGLYPAPHLKDSGVRLQPVLRLVSQIIHLQTFPAGVYISYGVTYQTKREERIATIPIGYGDGVNAQLSNVGYALIRGKRVPIVGEICMNQLMLNVTDVQEASLGDEVVLYGEQGDDAITLEEIAEKTGTKTQEVLCAINAQLPRLYVNDGQANPIYTSVSAI